MYGWSFGWFDDSRDATERAMNLDRRFESHAFFRSGDGGFGIGMDEFGASDLGNDTS